jgi:hypothetical protein
MTREPRSRLFFAGTVGMTRESRRWLHFTGCLRGIREVRAGFRSTNVMSSRQSRGTRNYNFISIREIPRQVTTEPTCILSLTWHRDRRQRPPTLRQLTLCGRSMCILICITGARWLLGSRHGCWRILLLCARLEDYKQQRVRYISEQVRCLCGDDGI